MAVSRAQGALAALPLVDALLAASTLQGYAPLHAVHGDVLEQLGHRDAAHAAFLRAIKHTRNAHERAVLLARADACLRA